MTLLVAITGWQVEPWADRFRRLLPERKIVVLDEPFDRRAVDFAVAWKHPPGSLAGLPHLEAVFSLGAGVDHLLSDPKLPDVPIARVVDSDLTDRMSEYVVMHCLMLLRQRKRYAEQQTQRLWLDDKDQRAAADLRVGIMGMGVLGKDAATKLRVMGFDVAGWSRSGATVDGVRGFAGEAELPAFLARTDVLVVLLPLTPETRGIVNGRLLDGLARDGAAGGPALINAGRGGLQIEADILDRLDRGVLSHAVLDVFETEPLPVESRLWTHPGVTVTPHNAAMSDPDAIGRLVVRQIRRLEAGGALENVVDPRRGY
jgi:glyoxylate/hydroxypyruvate reductase A